MTTRYIRRRPDRQETGAAAVTAAALAAGVGLVTYYVVRLLLARDVVAGEAPPAPGDAGPPGE